MNRNLAYAFIFAALAALLWLPDPAALILLTVVNTALTVYFVACYLRSKRAAR